MRRITLWIILVAFTFSCGGQWAAFQVIAWGNMIHEYAAVVPLTQAVEMTFSGQYPCPICKALAERKRTEHQKEFTVTKYDKQYPLPVVVTVPRPSIADTVYLEPRFSFSSRSETPPTPPPRDALS